MNAEGIGISVQHLYLPAWHLELRISARSGERTVADNFILVGSIRMADI